MIVDTYVYIVPGMRFAKPHRNLADTESVFLDGIRIPTEYIAGICASVRAYSAYAQPMHSIPLIAYPPRLLFPNRNGLVFLRRPKVAVVTTLTSDNNAVFRHRPSSR